jgi:hypothetical protein
MIAISRFCCFGILEAGDGLDRAAQRGQRVLDLVGDVGGEALDGVHARPERAVMSRSAPERSPISSRRRVKSGMSIWRPWPRRTRSAVSARRRIGRAIVRAR